MALGDQSKALIIVSKARGWDPTVIPARGDKPAESIANFNKAPLRPGDGDHCVGILPQGIPDTFPDADGPRYKESVTFNTPDYGRENKVRRTNGADPFSGMGGR